MPHYVVLRHETPADASRPIHWDLMLERDGTLWTWALPEVPRSNHLLLAERLADHRIAYLEYQGAISGGRGEVQRVMSGDFEFENVAEDRIQIRTTSGDLPRRVELVRQADSQRWKLTLDDGR